MIIGSRALADIIKLARKAAPSGCNVLITGETGTGKEVVAKCIHENSSNPAGPFVPINVAAIPHELIESQLFGHRQGAFTGAQYTREGAFLSANEGTLFLDEIGDLPIELQPSLLRTIEDKQIQALGSDRYQPADVRIIAATSRNLEELIDQHLFRRDLYYRLNTIHLDIPPLRERPGDIPLLANYYLDRFSRQFDKPSRGLTPNAEAFLFEYSWPGNVRELQHVIEHAVVMSETENVELEDFPPSLVAAHHTIPHTLKQAVASFKHQYVKHMLEKHQGDRQRTADALGISLATLYRCLDEMDLSETRPLQVAANQAS